MIIDQIVNKIREIYPNTEYVLKDEMYFFIVNNEELKAQVSFDFCNFLEGLNNIDDEYKEIDPLVEISNSIIELINMEITFKETGYLPEYSDNVE